MIVIVWLWGDLDLDSWAQLLPKTQKLCQNIKIAEELKVLYRFAIITQIMKNKVDRVKVAAEVALLLNLPFCPYLTWCSPRG